MDNFIPPFYAKFKIRFLELGGFWYDPALKGSPPEQEIIDFLSKFDITCEGIHLCMYKPVPERIGTSIENPHLDSYNGELLHGRLNIVYQDDGQSILHWWNKTVGDPEVVSSSIVGLGNRYQVKGNSSAEKVDILGAPDVTIKELSVKDKTANFVRTDILHSIERSGNTRILISAKLSHSWEEIVNKVNGGIAQLGEQ